MASLAARLTALAQAVGADVKKLDFADETRYWEPVLNAQTANINVAAAVIAFSPPMVPPSAGSRILLVGQTNKTQNGFWVYNGSGAALTRDPAADSSSEFIRGMLVHVMPSDEIYQYQGPDAPTLGTTDLPFVRVTGHDLIKTLWGMNKSLETHSADIEELQQSGGVSVASYFRAKRSATVGLAASWNGPIGFDSEDADPLNQFNGSRFQPKAPGWYRCSSTIMLNGLTASASPELHIRKNGSSIISDFQQARSDGYVTASVETLVYFNGASDYVEVFIWMPAAGASLVATYSTFEASLDTQGVTNPARRIKGRVNANGTVAQGGSLFTVSKLGAGVYQVNFTSPFVADPVVTVTPYSSSNLAVAETNPAVPGSVIVGIIHRGTGAGLDTPFSFVAEDAGLGLQATMDLEPWSQLGSNGSSLGANIGHWGGGSFGKFRKDPMGKVHCGGRIMATGAVANGATLFTFPAGYRPALNDPEGVYIPGSVGGWVSLFDNGVVRWEGGALANGNLLYLTSISFFAGS